MPRCSLLSHNWQLLRFATHPSSCQPGAVDLCSAEIDGGDTTRIRDVLERIGIQHDEVSALACRYRACVRDLIKSAALRVAAAIT